MLKGAALARYGGILMLFGLTAAIAAQIFLDDPALVGAGVGFMIAGGIALILGKRSEHRGT